MAITFPINLGLNPSEEKLLKDAASAVKSEYRDSVRWKRLCARRVTSLDDGLFQIEVGSAIEFDWTWEGATAFKPPSLDGFDLRQNLTEDQMFSEVEASGGHAWYGEVLEVDQEKGLLVVNASESEYQPRSGDFFVKPFEFLYYLNLLYNNSAYEVMQKLLPARLKASQGGQYPVCVGQISTSLPELKEMWLHSWGVLWGPPGTGKTTTIGKQVGECISDENERVLVVSTTNVATDEVALSIGESAGSNLKPGHILRIGKGAKVKKFQQKQLEVLLKETEVDLLLAIAECQAQLKATRDSVAKANLRRLVKELQRKMKDAGKRVFEDEHVQVVVSTAYNAVRLLADSEISQRIAAGEAPFTTVIIDEAGLLSRATVAAISLLAAKRVVLVGDPKQLAPISKVSRILPAMQQNWLAQSGISHLHDASTKVSGVHLLRTQYRMHREISHVISSYQYRGQLQTDITVADRRETLPQWLAAHPRAVWYVLDEDFENHHSIRAQRGPGGISYVREATRDVLDKLFSAPGLRETSGLFVTPFAAQARDIDRYFHNNGIAGWSAGTVHSQQGVSVDMVIFDTVHAGSTGWPHDEWKRIVNVGLSRARYFAMLIASRDEMQQPFLHSLAELLTPIVQSGRQSNPSFSTVEGLLSPSQPSPEEVVRLQQSVLLGDQIAARKALRPLMTSQQQRLVNLKLDGGPRLVRGVAGSGKTIVLARWLQQVAASMPAISDEQIWVVYANQSLGTLIQNMIHQANQSNNTGAEFDWARVNMQHVKDVLHQLEGELGIPEPADTFNFDARSSEILHAGNANLLQPRCVAMFIDEAQDMGFNTLKLLNLIVKVPDQQQPGKRPVHIFYDNAQNLFNRSTPIWSEIGLDMRGRSVVMEESFRSTRPITEFALNVYFKLRPPTLFGGAVLDSDNKELMDRELIERTEVNGMEWWRVHYNAVNGPIPEFKRFDTRATLNTGVAQKLVHLISKENLCAEDIVVLCNSGTDGYAIVQETYQRLAGLGVHIEYQTSSGLNRIPGVITVTTPHSFKGYDAEVVIVAHAQNYVARGSVLPSNLYVAMTRARSQLLVCAVNCGQNTPGHDICNAMQMCHDAIYDQPALEAAQSIFLDKRLILEVIGERHQTWLEKLLSDGKVTQEAIIGQYGEIVAEPAFRYENEGRKWACFVDLPGKSTVNNLEDMGINVLVAGTQLA
jgi:KaiC/GvpD/RAD55 family RecA-like ATPase